MAGFDACGTASFVTAFLVGASLGATEARLSWA
jgi:hypothetical protein